MNNKKNQSYASALNESTLHLVIGMGLLIVLASVCQLQEKTFFFTASKKSTTSVANR